MPRSANSWVGSRESLHLATKIDMYTNGLQVFEISAGTDDRDAYLIIPEVRLNVHCTAASPGKLNRLAAPLALANLPSHVSPDQWPLSVRAGTDFDPRGLQQVIPAAARYRWVSRVPAGVGSAAAV
jgi:hypothetical protein